MAVLRGEEIVESQALLLDVFYDGYGENYVGNDRFYSNYLLPAHVAITDDRSEFLAGAALMRNSRITAIATRYDTESFGNRFQNMVGILQFSRLVDPEGWIAIGASSKQAMKAAAQAAGMGRSRDSELLEDRLERSGKRAEYTVKETVSGLLICLASSGHGSDYWQEVWDWDNVSSL